MSTPQHFHRFRDLPRELQLRIWEFYESTHRHYFRKMMVWSGRLYAGADQYTHRRIYNIANAGDPDQTEILDEAVAPNTKILLPSRGNWDAHWVSQDLVPIAASFLSIQVPRNMDRPAYIWVNFKNDTFCFARASENISGENKDFLEYLKGATGLFHPVSGPRTPIMSHWFFRIQKLVLIKSAALQTLGSLDRQVLRVHPSLRRVTIVAVSKLFRCDHFRCTQKNQANVADGIERLPLTTFLALRQATSSSCASDCGGPNSTLDEIDQLRQDLVDLFQNRASTLHPVDVDVEVEVFRN